MNNIETLKALQALKKGIADAEQHLMLLGQLALKMELSLAIDETESEPLRQAGVSGDNAKKHAEHLPETTEELLVNIGHAAVVEPEELLPELHLEKKPEIKKANSLKNSPSGENLNEKLGKTKTKATPAEQFEGGHLEDLKKAIPLNLKLAFIKHVFKEDADAYNKAIEYLNTCGNEEAEKFIAEIQVKESGLEPFAEFKALVGRRWA